MRHRLDFALKTTVRLFALTALVTTVACATLSPEEEMEARNAGARASRDTNTSDLLFVSQAPGPAREKKHWEFFYKDCDLARRNRQLSRNEWECTGPK